MSNYGTVLKALFRNKLRFDDSKSKGKKLAFSILIGVAYASVMAMFISLIVKMKQLFLLPGMALMFNFFILLTAAVIVLFFGIVHLVSTLYLSKDTSFYSMLPIKPATVFAAKLSYVYISETSIMVAISLPLLITFGVVAEMWAWFYVISIATLFVVPALPLMLAAVFALPVMLIASKLKNRNVISLVFYLVLFGAVFFVYIYFIYLNSYGDVTDQSMSNMLNSFEVLLYVLYPYTVLAYAACGIPMYGMSTGASTAVGPIIFVAVSAALIVIIWFLAKFMYAQSVKANDQTDNSKAKKSEFKSTSATRALIKREYLSSMRTTQTAFQCYAVMLLPIIMAVIFGIMSSSPSVAGDVLFSGYRTFIKIVGLCTLCAMFSTLGNAASTTFSREGGAMASLKILPVKIKTVLKAKLFAWLFLTTPVATVAVVVFNVMNFAVQDMLLSLFSLVPISVVFVIFGALWDLISPKLKWTDPIQAVKHNMHVLGGQMIMMASGFTVLIFVFILSGIGGGLNAVYAVSWSLLYAVFVAFAIVDIVLYRRIGKYYDRIEV